MPSAVTPSLLLKLRDVRFEKPVNPIKNKQLVK
jgi:hypothetical protein